MATSDHYTLSHPTAPLPQTHLAFLATPQPDAQVTVPPRASSLQHAASHNSLQPQYQDKSRLQPDSVPTPSPTLSTTRTSVSSIATPVSSSASSVSRSILNNTLHTSTAPAFAPSFDRSAELPSHPLSQHPAYSSIKASDYPSGATPTGPAAPLSDTSLTDISSAPIVSPVDVHTNTANKGSIALPVDLPAQHPLSTISLEQEQQQLQLSAQGSDPRSLPLSSTAAPTRESEDLAVQSFPTYSAPTRATTLDVRKTYPGSPLMEDSAIASSRRQQPLSPGERTRRRNMHRRNTFSAEVGSTSFHRSDDEMDELEEARRRMEALRRSSSRRRSKRKKDDDNDRVLIGTRIGEDHVNYVLMYNMLTGIRVSVSRCQAKPQRALVEEDFTAAHKLAFDITGNELTPSSKYDFKFKDYAPWVFRHLRQDFHIDASDYLVSLTSKYILSELGSPGKSGSFFYFSQDYRFIIKTIHHAEHKFMRKILKDYFNHVTRNPHTLLCRFFGLHRVKLPHGRKIHFVVMGNVFPPNRDIHETFDLKGSTLGRAISDEELTNNPRATQKDLNWVNKNRKLELGPVKRHLFVEQIKRDVELLAKLNIMDYSLLVGIHDIERGNRDNIRDNTLKVFQPETAKPLVRETSRRDKRESKVNALRIAVKASDPKALGPSTLPSDSFSERRYCIFYADDGGLLSTNEQNEAGEDLYYLGIIDILTPYNYVKKIEHYWKSLSQDKHAISAVNPNEYAQRFLSFMIHALKVNHDVMAVLDKNSHPHSE